MLRRIFPAVFALFFFAQQGRCGEKSPASVIAENSQASKPEAEKSQAEDPVTVKISGVFQSLKEIEILADTEHITALEIKRIVAHGSNVRQSQTVVSFKAKDIDKQIKEAEIDFRLAKLTLDDDEFVYQQFLKTQDLDRQEAERNRKHAQQAYDNFVQVDRDRNVLAAEFNVKSSQASLDNAREELEQLEQMYKEDDLTEESEEIVLKRAKRSVEVAEYRLAGTKIGSRRAIQQSIPNELAQQKASLAKAQLAYQKAIRDLSSARRRRHIEMHRKRDKFKEQETKLAELRQERKKIALAAPIDGIVLHGPLRRGKLADKPSTLKAGTKVKPNQVIATVVNPRKLQIRVALDQKDLSKVSVGEKCKVTCQAFPEFETTGTVKSVSSIAYAGTKHDCVVKFKTTKRQPMILPTMICDLEFTPEEPAKDE